MSSPLVLVHGWGMNRAVWQPCEPLFAGREVCALDLPGHGGSDPAATGLAAWAERLLAAAPARAVWIGWSLGALVALAAALRAPERVAGLIALAGTPCFVARADWPCAVDAGVLAQFAGALDDQPARTRERFLALQVRGSERAGDVLRTLKLGLRELPEPPVGTLRDGLELLRTCDLRSRLAGLVPPSLWLFGARDTLVPAATAARLPGLCPGATVAVCDGAGHAPFLSHPQAVAARLGPFLEHNG